MSNSAIESSSEIESESNYQLNNHARHRFKKTNNQSNGGTNGASPSQYKKNNFQSIRDFNSTELMNQTRPIKMRNCSISSTSTCTSSTCSDGDTTTASEEQSNLPYPGFPEISLKYLTQTTRPRNWCLLLITNPWFERISIIVILLNCITLGMYQPCVDDKCETNRCKILQVKYSNLSIPILLYITQFTS